MTSARKPARLVCVAVLLASCGSRVDGSTREEFAQRLLAQPSAAPPLVVTATGQPVEPPSPQESSGAPRVESPPSPDARTQSRPDEAPSSTEPIDDEPDVMPLSLSVDPVCVAHGQRVTITVQTLPRAQVTKAVGYSDGQPHGQMGFHNVDDTGVYHWRWIIGPDVPSGRATAIVMVNDEHGDRTTSDTIEFGVAQPNGECTT